MEVNNRTIPSDAQLAGFGESPEKGPIHMVNLLKFREKAEYADGRETALTGEEAYALYGQGVYELLQKHGGGLLFSGDVSRLMLGEVADLWDRVAIAYYPSRQAMLDMIPSEAYLEIAAHREAGLEGQINIETMDALVLAPN